MEVKYKLFGNKKGIVKDRIPHKFSKDVVFSFEGLVGNYTLILKDDNKDTLYRQINGGTCVAPLSFLKRDISVIVVDLNDSIDKKYICEGIICQQEQGFTWIMPEGINILNEIVEAQNQIDKLSSDVKTLSEAIARHEREYHENDII